MNKQQALEALLAGKKITYKSFGEDFVAYLKNNQIVYSDTSTSPLEQWLRLPHNHTFYEYVEKPKFPKLKDVPRGSLIRFVDLDGKEYGSVYLKTKEGLISDSFIAQSGNHDECSVKVVGEVKW